MKTLADIGIIPEANIASLTPVVEQELLAIPTTEVDDVERKVTIRIDGTGAITLVMPQVEMGQGVCTAIAMILAEELDADFAQVSLEHAPPNDKLYGNPLFGIQVTGNSNSIRSFWKPLRDAGATARATLVQAAAQQLEVDPASCTTSNSEVMHKASGRKLSYGAPVAAASGQTPPKDAAVKDPKDFVLIGKPLHRLDTPDKVNGKAVYGIDAILPGMKFATLKACPVFGGKVGKVDDSAARQVAGVRDIVVLVDFVAVVGDHMWAAKKGLDALVIEWDEGPHARINSNDIWQNLRTASEKDGVVAKSVGDIVKGLATGDRLEASYELPFLAHATMARHLSSGLPRHDRGYSVRWQGRRLEIQGQRLLGDGALAAAGVPERHRHRCGR